MEEKFDYKAAMKVEYARCLESPMYFMKRYVYIQAKGGRQLFVLYKYQEKLLHLIIKNDKTMILKSRQLGITTLCAAYCLWLMVFFGDQSILALAPDKDKAKEIIGKIRFAYDELPSWLKDGAKKLYHNTTTLELKNGSKAVALAGTPDSARSKAANFLILDEAAFIDNAEDLWAAAQQTQTTYERPKTVVLSTPNGVSNWFYKFWQLAEGGTSKFVPVRLPWQVHPERTQKWRDEQDADIGKKLAAQECDCSFQSSGNTYLDSEDIEYYSNTAEDPVEMRGAKHDYWIWKYPHEVKGCMIIVDTAKGDGGDNSTIEVIEILTGDQVAEYQGQMEPKELAKFAKMVGREYNNGLIIVENTGIGFSTVSHLTDPDPETGDVYMNIYLSPKTQTNDAEDYIDQYNKTNQDDMQVGFPTNVKTRPWVIHSFRQAIMERHIKLRSSRLHSEMKTFIWKNGKPQAGQGFFDDLFMCFAIGTHLRDTAIAFQSQGIEMQKAVLGGIKKSSALAAYAGNQAPKIDPWKQRMGQHVEDISWVIGNNTGDW